MLQFFRRIVSSRVGIIVTFAVLAMIAVLFGLGDVTGLRGGGVATGAVAGVGGTDITTAEMRRSAGDDLAAAQAEQPTLTLAQFVDGGGVDASLARAITGLALEIFGHDQGMVVSRRMVDGQIAGLPSLQGPDGRFDPRIYQQLLQQRHLTDMQVHADIARQTIAQQLVLPTVGASQVPDGMVTAYAALLLEKRQGAIGIVPASAMPAGAAATPAELQAFYSRNRARYTVPERRAIRYALVSPATVAGTMPTEAEIAAAYQTRRAEFQQTEKRSVTQVSVLDQTAANAIAAKVKAGTSVAVAARAAGLEPLTLAAQTKAAYAGQTTAAVADAVFAATRGAVVGPVRGPVGFVVGHIDAVEQIAGRSLDQARPDLVKTLSQTKATTALGRIHDALQDGIARHANVAELAADQHLAVVMGTPLTATGVDPDHTNAKPDATLAPLLAAAFAAEQGDDPQLVQTGADGSFAIVSLDRIVPAAPRPLALVQSQVASDLTLDRQARAARTAAGQLLAKVNGGTPLAQAFAQSGLKLPPVQPVSAVRAQVMQAQQGNAAPLKLLFSMAVGTATVLEAPGRAGWLVLRLDRVTPGDARTEPRAVTATQGELRRVVGREYAEEFTHAVQAKVGVKRNEAAIAQLKADLVGKGGSDQ